jgi:two-component system sensor histidine kinase YesM
MNAQFTRRYGELTAKSNQQILDQLSYNLNMYLDEIYRLTLMPYYNRGVMNELKTDPETPAEKQSKRRSIEEFLIGAMVFPRQDIQRVCIISDALYFSDRIAVQLPTYEETRSSQWYRDVITSGKPLIVLPGNNDRYFSIANVIRDLMDNTQILGVIKADADYSTIRQLCENVDMGSSGGVIILTGGEQPVYSSFSPEQTRAILADIKTTGMGEADGGIYSQTYLYNAVTLSRFNWRVITANSLDSIKGIYAHTRRLTIFVVLIGIFVSAMLMYLLMQYLLKPFFSIIKLMKEIEAGDSVPPSIPMAPRYQGKTEDEIGYLGAAMNTMLDRIDAMFRKNTELNKRIYQARLFQRETQILLLYSQIRPHFIYNALNMISTLIQQNQDEQAVDNINKLSLMLHGIAYINKEIPIGTELKLVESYLAIQQSRYRDRLTYSIDVKKELQDYIVPALILQPIAENAVIHSGEDTREKTHIRIYSEERDGVFCICISDNGGGMPQDKLDELNRQMQMEFPVNDPLVKDLSTIGGLGLVNVNTRIRMRFGREYGLEIDSQAGKGSVVAVILPRQWKEAENIDPYIDS